MSKYLCLVSLLLAVAMVNSELTTVKFGSKSRYSEVSPQDIDLKSFEGMGYAATKGFLVIRQASCASTSFANENLRENVHKYQEKVKTLIKEKNKVFNSEVLNLLNWNANPLMPEDPDLLKSGVEEMSAFANRLKMKFSNLFTPTYDAKKYPMKVIPKPRVTKSAVVLLKFMFPETEFTEMSLNKCTPQDALLMNDYTKSTDIKNKHYLSVKDTLTDEYKKSQKFNSLRDKLAKKLEIDVNDVDYGLVQGLFESCRWERIHFIDQTPAPCNFFDNDDIENLLEVDNIQWFTYASTQINPFNAFLACGMFDHLRRFLKSDETNGPVFPIYAAHRSNILVLQMALGLNTDQKTFDTSTSMPFISNIVVVVFKKTGAEDMVGIYINEKLTEIPLDSTNKCLHCPLTKVIVKLENYLQEHQCEKHAKDEDFLISEATKIEAMKKEAKKAKGMKDKDGDEVMKDKDGDEVMKEKRDFFYSLPPY